MSYSILTVFKSKDPFYGEILKFLQSTSYEAIACRSGEEAIKVIKERDINKVVEAMKEGAYDFYEKPVDFNILNQIIKKALEKQRLYIDKIELERQLKERLKFKEVIGRSKKMQQVLETVRMVAPKRSNCLIYGESGRAKELIARTIHNNSPRKERSFIAINCAALSEEVLWQTVGPSF